MDLKEKLSLCHYNLKKLIRNNFNESHAQQIMQKLQSWIYAADGEFEMDLLNTFSNITVSMDGLFRISNEYGNVSEIKMGSFAYTLILLILYSRYLIHVKECRDTDIFLNHGLRFNLRCVPVSRLLLDVDIDNSKCTETMAKEGLKFLLWTVMHFVEPGTRVLVTKNSSVPNTQSFHMITETQFDIVTCELLRDYCVHQMRNTMRIDIVNMWTLPNGRFHLPDAVYTSTNVLTTTSYKDVQWDLKLISIPLANGILSFDEWLLMAPFNVFSIDKTYSILEETMERPSHDYYCIMTMSSGTRYLSHTKLMLHRDEDIGCIRREKYVNFIKYIKLFSSAVCIDVPRQFTNSSNRIVVDLMSINLPVLRLLFPSQCKQVYGALTAGPQDVEFHISSVDFDVSDLNHPHEFYEVLLNTKFEFIDDSDFRSVFKEPMQLNTVVDKIVTNYDELCHPTFQINNKIDDFLSQQFTYTFRPIDIQALNHCYSFTPEQNAAIINAISKFIWDRWNAGNKYTSAIIKVLYLHRCQRLGIAAVITSEELDELVHEIKELGINATFTAPMCNGNLSLRSSYGMAWNSFVDPNVRILIHCLFMAIRGRHTFATLALVVGSRGWKSAIIKNAIILLMNLFVKDPFLIANADSNENVYVKEMNCRDDINNDIDVESLAPVQTLFLFARYFNDVADDYFFPVLLNTFRFEFMAKFLFTFEDIDDDKDMGSISTCVLDRFSSIFSFGRCDNNNLDLDLVMPPAGRSNRRTFESMDSLNSGSGRTKNKKPRRSVSQFYKLYQHITEMPDILVRKFIVQHIVPMYRQVFFNFVYSIDRYILDDKMPEDICCIIPSVEDTESKEFAYWYRREIGIYNSYYGAFDAHSSALYSGVCIETPSFITNVNSFNMFDIHYKNRMFNVLMKGVHFADIVDYQRTALILCGPLYPPSRTTNNVTFGDEVFTFAVPSCQVSHVDVKCELPHPRSLLFNIYKSKLLKHLYFWMYMIICEMSQMITINVAQPSKYIFSCLDPSSDMFSTTNNLDTVGLDPTFSGDNSNNSGNINNNANVIEREEYTTVCREFMRKSFLIQSLTQFLHSDSTNNLDLHDKNTKISYLHRLVPSKMQHLQFDDFSPYVSATTSNIFNMEDMWINTMNMEPSDEISKLEDIDEIIRSNIQNVGGPEFEFFILLLMSWHIRVLHPNPFSSTKYMIFIRKHRQQLYDELIELVETTIGPFFKSSGHSSLVHYFQKFTKMTRITIDPLSFNLAPPHGFILPSSGEEDYIGEKPVADDRCIHEGVISLAIQSQFNKETMVDFLKIITKCTRPVNRERISMALLNRMRSGKNVLVDELVQNVFKSKVQNSFRSHELVTAESENVGNKLYQALNRNLLVSFDEVATLPNVFKVICNNGCISGRPLFTEGICSLWINAHPILCSNSDPVCKECAVIDRVRAFDRFYQFTSFNIAAIFPRKDSIHDINTPEINDIFAVQNLLQVLPKESMSVGAHGLYMLIWQMAPMFAYTQTEPCTQRFTSQMQKTMTRFFIATDPAKYIISHKIVPSLQDPITVQAFKGDIQTVVSQDKTIPRSTNFNLNSIIHDILDRLQAYMFNNNGVEYIKMKVST